MAFMQQVLSAQGVEMIAGYIPWMLPVQSVHPLLPSSLRRPPLWLTLLTPSLPGPASALQFWQGLLPILPVAWHLWLTECQHPGHDQ